MLRTIKNVLLIIIVCLTATGMPIFAYIASAPESKGTVLPVEIAMNVTIDELKNTQYQFTLKIFDKNAASDFSSLPKNPVILELYHNEVFVKAIDLDAVWNSRNDSELTQNDNAIVDFTIIIDQEQINLPDGKYKLKVIPNIKDIDSSLATQSFSLAFYSDFSYIPSLKSVPRNNMGLILYFPDTEFINLIPITRVIPFTTKPLRATLNNLLAGVDESLGLPLGAFTPDRIRLGLENRTAQLFLPSDIGRFETNSTDARIALYSLANSLNTITAVNRVQFYFNNQIVRDGFHGHAMDKPYYSTNSNIYVGIRTKTNRVLLAPIPMVNFDSIENIFNQLKFNYNREQFSFNTLSTIPTEVVLNNYSIEGKVLKLNLSPSFLTFHRENEALQNLMVESILYTFTSLTNVAHVQFDVNDTETTTIGRYPIGKPIRPSRYINPEK